VITICFTYFKSLSLANLAAALFSVRQQDLSRVESIVVVDNDTADPSDAIRSVIDDLSFPVPVQLLSFKHGDPTKTHSWSTNVAVREAVTPWVLFCRADYLLDFSTAKKFATVAEARPDDWDGFITGHVYHLVDDIAACERVAWRCLGPQLLRECFVGTESDYTCIDAGVWMARRSAFDRVGALDEELTAWGHAQTHFQHKLHATGTECVRIPEALFYHPQHTAVRDLDLAHQQLRSKGIDLKQMWARYHGAQVY